MRVKIKPGFTLAGPYTAGRSGHVIDVDPDEGEQLVAGGYAEAVGDVEPPPARETRLVGPAEKAVIVPAERTTAAAAETAAEKNAAKAKAKADRDAEKAAEKARKEAEKAEKAAAAK
ncbi:MAG TPA: hypothetical protein VGE52_09725 [Pirellulales bacterium]